MRIVKVTLVSIITMVLVFTSTVASAKYSSDDKEIIIDIPSRKLFLFENDEIVKEYPVAVGLPSTQTPVGQYHVVNKVIDPYYAKLDIPGGSSRNPLGSRWIGFKTHYGIHGNSDPNSIGTFASAGCVRMYERDVQELYNTVSYNVPVTIQYELVKVLKDVDGEAPILLVYPDYYNYGIDLSFEIDSKLKEIGLYNNIPKERLASLKKEVSNKITLISDSYTYFINDTYITKDVIKIDEEFYINKSKFENFFNISINSIYEDEYCVFEEERIHEIFRDGKKYISTTDLERVFGGNHSYNDMDLSLELSLENYILLNDSLVRGQGIALLEYPIVPLYDLIEPLNIDVKITRDDVKLTYNGQELKVLYNTDGPYISLEDLEEVFGVKTNLHTSKKFIELYTEPVVIYNGNIFKSIREGNEILVPLDIFSVELFHEDLGVNKEHFLAIGNLETLKREGKSFVRLSDVIEIEGYVLKQTDSYNTNFYLEKRTF